MTELIILSIILIIIIFVYFYYFAIPQYDGYWMATDDFLDTAGIDFACAFIQADIFVWLVESAAKPITQSYKIINNFDSGYDFKMISGEGSPVFGKSIKIIKNNNILTIKDDILLFEGTRLN